jgi:hypothetical protein
MKGRGSRHGKYIRFIEKYVSPPKGEGHGRPMRLGLFQKEGPEEALDTGIDAAVRPTPRGNGKSTGGGAIAIAATFLDVETGAPQVPIVATTVTQAIRSVLRGRRSGRRRLASQDGFGGASDLLGGRADIHSEPA